MTCPNCDAVIDSSGECAWCEFNRRQLLERLSGGRDDALSWMVVAAMAVHGWREKEPERVWWVR